MCFCLGRVFESFKKTVCKIKREIITSLDHGNLDISACTMAQIRCAVTSKTPPIISAKYLSRLQILTVRWRRLKICAPIWKICDHVFTVYSRI
jgi:hypothetical protein